MSVSVWNKRIDLWLQVKYSILCMNNIVLLCFLFINPGFCLQFGQSIPWHTLWQTWLFFVIICIYCQAWNLPKIYLAIICDSQDMMLKRASKSVSLGMPISCPACWACQTRGAKTKNELSIRREIWDLSLAGSILDCEGMNPLFPCLWDAISKYHCSLEFCHA